MREGCKSPGQEEKLAFKPCFAREQTAETQPEGPQEWEAHWREKKDPGKMHPGQSVGGGHPPRQGSGVGKVFWDHCPEHFSSSAPPGMLSVRTRHGPLMCRQAVKAAGKSSGTFVGTSEMGNCSEDSPNHSTTD